MNEFKAQPQLSSRQSTFQASLGYIKPHLKTNTQTIEKKEQWLISENGKGHLGQEDLLAQKACLYLESLALLDAVEVQGTETASLKPVCPTGTVRLRVPRASGLPIGLVPTQAEIPTLMVANLGGA